MERARLYTAERHSRLAAEATSARLVAIQSVTETALAQLSLKDLLHELLARISAILHADTAAAFFEDESGEYLVSRSANGPGEASEDDIPIPLGAGFTGRVAAERRAVGLEDVEGIDILDPRLRALPIQSLLGAPLIVEGRVMGVVHVGTVRRHQFTPDEEQLLQLVADRMALVIGYVRLYEAEQSARGEAESLAAERDAILRRIADVVVIGDQSGTVVFANDVARGLLGLRDPDAASIAAESYQFVGRDGQPYTPGGVPLTRAARHGDAIDSEFHIRRSDGTERDALASAVPVVAEDGTRHGAVLTLHDVTAQRELERQKEEFFANVLHDLRTPITTIKASISVVLENEPLGTPEPLRRLWDEYYHDEAAFLYAVADAMKTEYEAIANAELVLQIDDLALVTDYDETVPLPSIADYRKSAALRVEVLNHALGGIPEERIRYHCCWGSWHGPHTFDLPLKEIVDLMLSVKAGAYMLEAGNVRHELDWQVWQETRLPDGKLLGPGVVSHATPVVETPELVAYRIQQYADLVGRENVTACTDCGMGDRAHPEVAWAKLRVLAEGATLASRALWGG